MIMMMKTLNDEIFIWFYLVEKNIQFLEIIEYIGIT